MYSTMRYGANHGHEDDYGCDEELEFPENPM
jgi:hypothetical protein